MDTLMISDLELQTKIGVPDVEREKEQRILLSITLEFDTKKTAATDDVLQSINYWDVAERLKELATIERKTIERFAEDTAHMILAEFKPSSVTITVKKFAIPGSAYVALTITRP